jgi:hypothetical protein
LKRLAALLLCLLLLCGCKGEESALSEALRFRGKLLSSDGCSFRAKILADYGEGVQIFTVDCITDREGQLDLTLREPETLADITAQIRGDSGKITFDGLSLGFPLLAEGLISPVAAPGILVNCWLQEFILSAGTEAERYRASYEKKISNKTLLLDTYFENGIPISADLCYNDSRIVSMEISDFRCL